jgi:hypothetical protein
LLDLKNKNKRSHLKMSTMGLSEEPEYDRDNLAAWLAWKMRINAPLVEVGLSILDAMFFSQRKYAYPHNSSSYKPCRLIWSSWHGDVQGIQEWRIPSSSDHIKMVFLYT